MATLGKICPKCGIFKDAAHYNKFKNGLAYACKPCMKNYPSVKINNSKTAHIKRRYGLSIEQYDELITQQNNKCAICLMEFINDKDRHMDHDHKTQINRAFLCFRCNSLLGIIEKETFPLWYNKALAYLSKYNGELV